MLPLSHHATMSITGYNQIFKVFKWLCLMVEFQGAVFDMNINNYYCSCLP